MRKVDRGDWLGDRRSVDASAPGEAVYLQMYENANDGWKATLERPRLTPLRLDGWQQGWLVPAGAGGTVELSYDPGRHLRPGLIGGAVGVRSCSSRPRPPHPPHPAASRHCPHPPRPGSWAAVALTAVLALVAGPFALLVPALALLAHFRPHLLVPLALVAMVGAGSSRPRGGRAGRRRRGRVQRHRAGLALLALAAAVVTVRGRASRGPVSVAEAAGGCGGESGPGADGPGRMGRGRTGPRTERRPGLLGRPAPSGPTSPYGPSGWPATRCNRPGRPGHPVALIGPDCTCRHRFHAGCGTRAAGRSLPGVRSWREGGRRARGRTGPSGTSPAGRSRTAADRGRADGRVRTGPRGLAAADL